MPASLIREAQSKQKNLWFFFLSTLNVKLDFPTKLHTNLDQLVYGRSHFSVAYIRELNPVHINRFGGFSFVATETALDLLIQLTKKPVSNFFYDSFGFPHRLQL